MALAINTIVISIKKKQNMEVNIHPLRQIILEGKSSIKICHLVNINDYYSSNKLILNKRINL